MEQDSSTLVGHDGPDTVDPWTGISEDVIRRFFDVLCIERGLPKASCRRIEPILRLRSLAD